MCFKCVSDNLNLNSNNLNLKKSKTRPKAHSQIRPCAHPNHSTNAAQRPPYGLGPTLTLGPVLGRWPTLRPMACPEPNPMVHLGPMAQT